MHELPITESILNIVLKHALANNVQKVLSVTLGIGECSDLESDWVQKYFDYLSKDTIAKGAKLKIERLPIIMKCTVCNHSFRAELRKIDKLKCPECGSDKYHMESGSEYLIKDMEVL